MKKIYMVCISIFMVVDLSAAVYKGQKYYKKRCAKCHGSGQAMAESKKMRKWKKLFRHKGLSVVAIHKDTKANTYMLKKKTRKELSHLKEFFVYFAEDSGRVPPCE